jgi:hypothetical protein
MTQAELGTRLMATLGAAAVMLVAACSGGSGTDTSDADDATTTTRASPNADGSITTEPEAAPPLDTTPPPDATEPDPGPPPLPALDEGQLLFFGAMPPKPDWVDYEIPLGAADYFDLFAPDAPWAEALENMDVFRLHAFQMRHYLDDDDLRLIIDWLDEHQVPLLFETEPLLPPDPDECDHAESFEGPYDLEMAQRYKDLGGTIAVVAIEQPFTGAHQLQGPRVCHYTLERIVGEVTDYMTEMRRIFPGVPMGSIEGLIHSPQTTPEDMALWIDSYEELAGEPLEFLHIDVDWAVPGWPEILRGIEQVADERGVPFGVLYNGSFESTSEGWLQLAAQNMAEYETNAGGTLDHVTFTTWFDQPDHVLPETDPGAYTSLINRYVGTRSRLEIAEYDAPPDAPATVRGQMVDLDGNGLAGQTVEVSIIDNNPTAATTTVTGVVPADATEASILTRVNVEGAVEGATGFRLYDVQYSEAGGTDNLVPNGDHSQGGTFWYIDGDPIGDAAVVGSDAKLDVGSGNMLAVSATADQIVFVNGESFPVTPGAEFEFSATFALDPSADGIGLTSLAFLNPDTRTTIRLEPVPQPLPPVVTDADGYFVIDLPALGDNTTLDLLAVGDLTTWPALLSIEL